jgi:ABC-type transporter Mla subunit MlaD
VSYFDESVQGIEVGSPIKFRGVTIGTVGKIMVAPDHRHIEVESELGVEELSRLGLDIGKKPKLFGAPRKLEIADDLRLQLVSAGLTGVKFLQLDFFDVAAYPPPRLPFPVPHNYIPTVPSMLKSLEESMNSIMSRLPQIADQTSAILAEIDVIVRDVSGRQIPRRIASTIDSVDGVVTRIERDDGLLTSIERASNAIGDALRDADGLGGQISETMAALQALARSMRMFTEALEQDPEMLLKGRSPEARP